MYTPFYYTSVLYYIMDKICASVFCWGNVTNSVSVEPPSEDDAAE